MRASECTHSIPYRPLSHSHPWFTGSESTPNNRTKRFDDDCSAPRHCTAQVTHEVSAVARSHGPGAEAVLARGQRTDRTDLHGVAREVGVERLVGEVQHLRAVAAVDEVDQRVARDLVREACAAPRTGCSARGRAGSARSGGSASPSGASPRRSATPPDRTRASGPGAGTRRPDRRRGSRADG